MLLLFIGLLAQAADTPLGAGETRCASQDGLTQLHHWGRRGGTPPAPGTVTSRSTLTLRATSDDTPRVYVIETRVPGEPIDHTTPPAVEPPFVVEYVEYGTPKVRGGGPWGPADFRQRVKLSRPGGEELLPGVTVHEVQLQCETMVTPPMP